MSDYIGNLVYRITGDTAGMESSLANAKSKADGFGSFMGGWAGKIAGLLGIAFTVDKAKDLAKEMANLAAEANVTARRFETTFPNAMDAANKGIEELTENFNYDDDAAQGVMATIGTMAQQMGITQAASVDYAKSMAGLGSDLAAYFGKAEKAEEYTDALAAAAKGMTREAKAMGLFLDDDHLEEYAKGLGKTAKEMNSAERAQAVLNVAMKQAGNMGVIGSSAASMDSFATAAFRAKNALEDAEKAAGKKLLPAVTQLEKEFERSSTPGGIFAEALDMISDAASQATKFVTKLLEKINDVAKAGKLESINQEYIQLSGTESILLKQMEQQKTSAKDLEQLVRSGKATQQQKDLYALYKQNHDQLEENVKIKKEIEDDKKQQDLRKAQAEELDIRTRIMRLESGLSETADERSDVEGFSVDKARRLVELKDQESKKLKEILDLGGKQRQLDESEIKITKHKTDIKPTLPDDKGADESKKKLDELYKQAMQFESTKINWDYIFPTGKQNTSLSELSDNMEKAAQEAIRLKNIKDSGGVVSSDQVDKADKAFTDAKTALDQYANSWQQLNQQVQSYGQSVNTVMSSVAAIVAASYKNQIDSLDEKQAAEEEAAGVADDTAVEKAQKEYDAAVKSGDAQLIAEKKKALKKAQIEEEFAKKKKDLEYRGAMVAWEFQVAQGALSIPLAVLNMYASMAKFGFVVATAASITAGIAASAQEAAIVAAKPKRSSYETGGVVPGSSYSGDNVPANVNSGEMILTEDQQKQLWNMANGNGASSGGGETHIHVHVGEEELYSKMYRDSETGKFSISKNAVSKR
jgi:hypothetical protein